MGLYIRDGSPYWWYSFKFDGKHRVSASTGTPDKKLAQKIYHAKRSEAQRCTYGFESKKLKLGELISNFIELHAKHAKRSWDDDVVRLARIKRFFGDVDVAEITISRLEEYRIHRLSEGISKSTVNREMAIIKTAFNKNIEWGKTEANPVRRIKFYSERENARMRYLEHYEKIKLLNACPTATKRIVFFALNTGMRQGEILNLKWNEVDYKNNLIRVSHSKAGKPRYVPMNSELVEMLKSMPSLSEYVFGTGSEKPKWGLYRNFFERAVREAKIENFCYHDLRHDYASTLVMKGVDIKTVQELLGHSSLRMTERYSHLSPAHKMVAVEMLPKGLMCYTGATVPEMTVSKNNRFALK